MASLQAPMMVLYLGAFAANKVEGMAYGKGFGLGLGLPQRQVSLLKPLSGWNR